MSIQPDSCIQIITSVIIITHMIFFGVSGFWYKIRNECHQPYKGLTAAVAVAAASFLIHRQERHYILHKESVYVAYANTNKHMHLKTSSGLSYDTQDIRFGEHPKSFRLETSDVGDRTPSTTILQCTTYLRCFKEQWCKFCNNKLLEMIVSSFYSSLQH